MSRTLIGLVSILLAVGAGYFFLYMPNAGGTGAPAISGTSIPFTPIASGTHSIIEKRTNYLVTSQDEFRQLWTMTDAATNPPQIDFTKDVVIAIFGGTEPTGGYSVSVSKILDGSQARNVEVSITKPGTTCQLTQAETTPYQIVEMPRSALPLAHSDVVVTKSCLQ